MHYIYKILLESSQLPITIIMHSFQKRKTPLAWFHEKLLDQHNYVSNSSSLHHSISYFSWSFQQLTLLETSLMIYNIRLMLSHY